MLAISHAATALLVKRRYPDAPMGAILAAAEAPGVLWVLLNLAGIEQGAAHLPYSHSVATLLALAALVWLLVGKLFRRRALGAAAATAIALHLLVDFVAHTLPLAPASALQVGLGLNATPPLAVAAAAAYGLLCWLVFRGGKALLAVILLFSILHESFMPSSLDAQPQWLLTAFSLQLASSAMLVWYFSRSRSAELEHPDRRLARAFA
jgi:hypothetical protein